MLGKQQIVISGDQFSGGLATADNLGDGGIGASSANINPIATPGAIRATYSYTKAMPGGISPVQMVASAEDASATTTYGRVAVDNNGYWYTITQSTILNPAHGTNGIYFNPVTDMVAFNNFNFATTNTGLARFNPATAQLREDIWTSASFCNQVALNANVPHSLLVYQNFLWLGSGNSLYKIDPTSYATTVALTLDANEIILALGIDPGTGFMMISVGTVTDGSETSGGRYFIELYDGYSSKVRRKIPIEGRVNGFQSVGGFIFASIDNTICAWNGNGFTFLRRLKNVTYSSNTLPNRHRMATMQNTLLVADGPDILAYGDIQNGKKVWYPLYTSPTSTQNDVIAFIGNNTAAASGLSPIVAAFTTLAGVGKAYYIEPLNTTGIGSGVVYTNNINFPRPVYIRGMRVFTTGITTTAGIGGVGIMDENNTVITPTVSTFVVSSGTKYWFDFPFEQKLLTLQPKLTINTQAFAINKVVIFYDFAE